MESSVMLDLSVSMSRAILVSSMCLHHTVGSQAGMYKPRVGAALAEDMRFPNSYSRILKYRL